MISVLTRLNFATFETTTDNLQGQSQVYNLLCLWISHLLLHTQEFQEPYDGHI